MNYMEYDMYDTTIYFVNSEILKKNIPEFIRDVDRHVCFCKCHAVKSIGIMNYLALGQKPPVYKPPV